MDAKICIEQFVNSNSQCFIAYMVFCRITWIIRVCPTKAVSGKMKLCCSKCKWTTSNNKSVNVSVFTTNCNQEKQTSQLPKYKHWGNTGHFSGNQVEHSWFYGTIMVKVEHLEWLFPVFRVLKRQLCKLCFNWLKEPKLTISVRNCGDKIVIKCIIMFVLSCDLFLC